MDVLLAALLGGLDRHTAWPLSLFHSKSAVGEGPFFAYRTPRRQQQRHCEIPRQWRIGNSIKARSVADTLRRPSKGQTCRCSLRKRKSLRKGIVLALHPPYAGVASFLELPRGFHARRRQMSLSARPAPCGVQMRGDHKKEQPLIYALVSRGGDRFPCEHRRFCVGDCMWKNLKQGVQRVQFHSCAEDAHCQFSLPRTRRLILTLVSVCGSAKPSFEAQL